MNRVSASGVSRYKERHDEVAGIIRREMVFKQHYMNIKEEASKLIATRYINKECGFAFLEYSPKGHWCLLVRDLCIR